MLSANQAVQATTAPSLAPSALNGSEEESCGPAVSGAIRLELSTKVSEVKVGEPVLVTVNAFYSESCTVELYESLPDGAYTFEVINEEDGSTVGPRPGHIDYITTIISQVVSSQTPIALSYDLSRYFALSPGSYRIVATKHPVVFISTRPHQRKALPTSKSNALEIVVAR